MCPPVVEAVDHKFRRLGILSELVVYQSDRLGLNYNLIILRAKLTPLKVAWRWGWGGGCGVALFILYLFSIFMFTSNV